MTTIYIETNGCSHNFADSEQMAGLLKQAKFELTEIIGEADVIIFNTCTVKSPTESAFFTRLNEVKSKYSHQILIIAGCIAQTDPKKLKGYPLLGTKQIHRVVEIVEEALHENMVQMLETGEMPPLNLPRIRKNPAVYILPISRGCLGACTFCKTKAARGNLVSYPLEDIKKEVETALAEGVKEIWLTSQDTGCYGFDLNSSTNPNLNLAKLLKELISLPPDFKIRIGMMNPNHLLKYKEEFLEIFSSPKIFKFVHLPLQSGDNQILKSMKRNYTVEEYKELVQSIRTSFPQVTLATDIIVGFPGETEEQNWNTLTLLRQLSPEVVNISRFWPRPGTKAAELKALDTEIVQHRSRIIADICKNISKLRNERWLDWEGEIIIDEPGKEPNQWIGRNLSYKPVIVEGSFRLGDLVKVKITKATDWDLRGEIIA
ncbi:MAG TPA: tRNA (N(6)-L-threonylcarbamoyladenosine(37)-C(2))-methylthiotransferase [Candidatus Nanoarchaeia archaeon]|nr:tRNA (N(6)-L-threonylcarbamoyladenosine(37)-C(2))-methylthiotransferase [Candidatus Nanoarchaeia archaeon]